MHRILSITAILLAFIPLNVSASPHRTISSVDGISNNAVLSLHQNSLGHIYLGTADGLNIWDGKQMTVYHAPDGYNYFFGNMIKHFHMFNEDILYIQTNYGLAKISTETGKIDFFHELESYLRILLTEEDLILALDSDHNLQAFDSRTRTISRNTNAFIPTDETVRRMVMLEDGRLCIFTAHDTYIVSMSRLQSGEISFTEMINLNMGCRYASQEFLKGHDKGHYLITTGERLCFFETESCKVSQITELGHLPGNTVTGIVPAEEGYYISFLTKGLYLLPEGSGDLVPTDIDCGIFTIIPDKMQPIIWVGTDSNGLIRYSRQDTDIVCLTYDKLPHSIKMPVRSIFVDRQRTLWFGTKGEGLYRIRNFDRVKKSKDIKKEDVEKFRSENTPLTDNSVYAITEGANGALWIGTGGKGLNCWSYREGRLREVSGSKSLGMVHSIVEENDSTIWVATDNCGAFRCTFAIRGDVPIITLVLHLNSLHAEAGAVQENTVPSVSENINVYNTLIGNRLPDNFKSSINPDHIYIMSKDKDISTFLAYFLADSYNTHSFGNNISLIERMEKHIPLAVIYDASSMQNRFKEYMEGIAGNKRLEQVTVIVLTSPLQVKEREEYVTLGADLCVSFPFNMDYLISALEKLLQKKKKNAEYHKLPTSTYTIEDGKFIHQDDKEFMHRLFTAIDENLADSRLSAAMIAEILGTSTRVMYRKLEQITDKKLHQIIRETRMRMASTLLSSTKLSVDEIMYKVGYDTRSTFFRNFKEVYGKTPKEYRNEVSQQAIESMTC